MPPVPPYERPPSWFARHRKMVIAGGCLLALFVFLAAAGLAAAIAFGVMTLVKSSGAYEDAISMARRSGEVRAALGEPVETGWLVTGSVHKSNGSESADLVIPLSGPRGEGTLYVTGSRDGGKWRYTVLEVKVRQSGERIPLAGNLPDASGTAPEDALPAEPTPDELPAGVTQ